MRKEEQKRDFITRSKFRDQLVTRFVNNLMLDGKKSTALQFFTTHGYVDEKVEEVELEMFGRKH